jgi:large subunit ribosomal protein L19
MEELVKLIQAEYTRDDIPEFKAGDTVNVHVRIKEGSKERVQQFKGTCIQRRGTGGTETFTVRKISSGVGVERIFPIHSPSLEKIEVLRRGKVRRARLFYIREKIGKKARIKE